MGFINRQIINNINESLNRDKSILLLGPRQTGKTTLLKHLPIDIYLNFIKPDIRLQYESNPSLLEQQIKTKIQLANLTKKPLVALDEVQKVPMIMDVVQDLIDTKLANFILTGSSARKLKNLLPGRVVSLNLDPLMLSEITNAQPPLLEDLLLFGSLPGIYTLEKSSFKETDLESYVTTYLEEEIRKEAAVRDLGKFNSFLELAAIESGNILNLSKISQQIGVSHTTIQNYYQIAKDCLIIEQLNPLIQSASRSKLTKSPKMLIFDLGIRRLCAKEGQQLSKEKMGNLFEQFISLEILRKLKLDSNRQNKLYFWRDPDGPEVDLVLVKDDLYIPIEIKYTSSPSIKDARHLKVFLSEYPNTKKAYIICNIAQPLLLEENLWAIPWQSMNEFLF